MGAGLSRVAVSGAARDPLTSMGMRPSKPVWLVVCSCGWERETVSEWAARSVSKLHPQLAPMDVAHVTRVEGPDGDSKGDKQLSLLVCSEGAQVPRR